METNAVMERGVGMQNFRSNFGWEMEEIEMNGFKGRTYKNRPKHIADLLETTAKKYPHREGFVAGDWRLTFQEFDRLANKVAEGLQEAGVKQGDRIALLLGVGMEFLLSFFALMKLGAIAVPVNTRFKGPELAYEINHSDSRMLLLDAEGWPQVASVRGELTTLEKIYVNGSDNPEGTIPFSTLLEKDGTFERPPIMETDTAAILYTSGTTGKPKGAILHHRGFVLSAMQVVDSLWLQHGDKMICCVPLFHATGLGLVTLPSVFAGIPCVFMRTFKVKDFLELMSTEKITCYMGVITVLWLMVNHADFDNYDFSSFRIAAPGGSQATEEEVRGILTKIPHLKLTTGYGLTEAQGFDTTVPVEEYREKSMSVGKAVPITDLKVVDHQGNELPPGSVGEITVRSLKVMKGYWKNPEATNAAIIDGWLRSGDIGKMDEQGYVYLLDRKKDMINRAGEKIYSIELENAILNHGKVLEVAVVGVPDKMMGEVVKAVIVLKAGQTATDEEIKKYCAERMADYKIPKYVEFTESLPRNPAGKVIKAALRYIPQTAR